MNGLQREVVQSMSLEILKTWLDKDLDSLIYLILPQQGSWANDLYLKAPFNLSYF